LFGSKSEGVIMEMDLDRLASEEIREASSSAVREGELAGRF
jgi:hypothetical protein